MLFMWYFIITLLPPYTDAGHRIQIHILHALNNLFVIDVDRSSARSFVVILFTLINMSIM